jgi:Right handed beta helix region
MKRGLALPLAAAAAACALALPAAASASTTRLVDDDAVQCPSATFTSIQAAVTASSPGDKVKVCNGTYTETVTVPAGKNNIKIFADHTGGATIQNPPAHTDGSIVEIDAKAILFRGFNVQGPFLKTDCSGSAYGISVLQNGQATIDYNHVSDIQADNSALAGCQYGVGILVGHASQSQVGKATVSLNTVDTYQKNGIDVDGPGSNATVERNTVDGGPTSPIIARNGIELGRSATGAISRNTVLNNRYGPSPLSTGILVFDVDKHVSITKNTVTANDYGIDLDSVSSGTRNIRATGNTIRDSVADGLGVYGSSSVGNVLNSNNSRNNGGFDCFDQTSGSRTAGTGNTWSADRGDTSSPAGLCKP